MNATKKPLNVLSLSLVGQLLLGTHLSLSAHSGDAHLHDPSPRMELRAGHIDLQVHFNREKGLHLVFATGGHTHSYEQSDHEDDHHDYDHGEGLLELDEAEVVVGFFGRQSVPEEEAFRFLGAPRAWVYQLPQAEREGVPFLGLSTEALDVSTIAGGVVLELLEVEGPGDFVLYQGDALGEPILYLQNAGDVLSLPTSGHVHHNWAFSHPGDYRLYVQLTAELVGGETVISEPQPIQVHVVGQPVWVRDGHAGLVLEYSEAHGLRVSLVAEVESHGHGEHSHPAPHDHGHGGSHFHPADVIVLLGGHALELVGSGSSLSLIGEEGTPFYRLTQFREHGVPFFGFEADDLDPEHFAGPIEIELHEVEGPGEVFLFTINSLGEVELYWDSRDAHPGVYPLPAGAHRHFNLAFTQSGFYALHLEIDATLAGGERVHAEALLYLQVGGWQGFVQAFEAVTPDWALVEGMGWLFLPGWPWAYHLEEGWLYALGAGGPSQSWYVAGQEGWVWTSTELMPWLWEFNTDSWRRWSE